MYQSFFMLCGLGDAREWERGRRKSEERRKNERERRASFCLPHSFYSATLSLQDPSWRIFLSRTTSERMTKRIGAHQTIKRDATSPSLPPLSRQIKTKASTTDAASSPSKVPSTPPSPTPPPPLSPPSPTSPQRSTLPPPPVHPHPPSTSPSKDHRTSPSSCTTYRKSRMDPYRAVEVLLGLGRQRNDGDGGRRLREEREGGVELLRLLILRRVWRGLGRGRRRKIPGGGRREREREKGRVISFHVERATKRVF